MRGRDIQAIGVIGDMAAIAFDQSMFVLDYTGNLRPPFNLRKTPVADGAVGPFSMANVGGALAVYGLRDIYLFNGHAKERSLTDNRLTQWLYDSVKIDFQPRLGFYPAKNEVHVLCRGNSAAEGDRSLIYNMAMDEWYPVPLVEPGGSGAVSFCFLGPRLDGDVKTWDDLTADGSTWNDLAGVRWNDFKTVAGDSVFYYVSLTRGEVIALDQAVGDVYFGQPLYITHGRFELDDVYDVKTIQRLFPRIQGFGTVQFRFGSAMNPDEGIQYGSWIDYVIGTDIAVDTNISGRYFAWEMRPRTAEVSGFSGFDVEVILNGRN